MFSLTQWNKILSEIIESRVRGKPTSGSRRIQMLHDLSNDGGSVSVAIKWAAEDVKNLMYSISHCWAVSGLLRFTICAGKFQLYGNVKRCENGGSEVNWKQKCNFPNVKGRNQYYQQCTTKVIWSPFGRFQFTGARVVVCTTRGLACCGRQETGTTACSGRNRPLCRQRHLSNMFIHSFSWHLSQKVDML